MKFADLTEKQKDAARDMWRDGELEHRWWEHTFECAIRFGSLLGIHPAADYISFAGFDSQGSGCNFSGTYQYSPDACRAIAEEAPNDKELARIASELTAMQVATKMQFNGSLTASIGIEHRVAHSGDMYIALVFDTESDLLNNIWEARPDADLEDDEAKLLALLRSFADWIYKQLKDEHDYRLSNENIDQYLAEQEFDEEGELV